MTAAHEPITDLTELVATWTTLLETAPLRRRNLWLMFLDPSARPLPALTQIEGLSLTPDARSVASLGELVRHLVDDDRVPSGAALCLERSGTTGASPFEEGWADALTRELGEHLAWPVLVRTPGGITPVRLWSSAA